MKWPSLPVLLVALLLSLLAAPILMGCGAGDQTTPTVAPPMTTVAATAPTPPTMPSRPTTASVLTSAGPTTTTAVAITAAPVVVPQGGTFHYGQATVILDGYWKQHRARGYEALSGSFPGVRVTVSCLKDCSLSLAPVLRFSDGDWVHQEPNGRIVQEEVDLAAGGAKSIAWYFEVVAPGAKATQLEIEVRDLTGQTVAGKAVFELGEPGGADPWSTTSSCPALLAAGVGYFYD